MKKYDLGTLFFFDEEKMKEMGIESVKKINNEEEKWTYAIFDNKKDQDVTKERRYLVSNYGRVYDLKAKKLKKIFKQSRNAKGYYLGIAIVKKNGVKRNYFVHRLVALAFIPNPYKYSKPFVNHKDGDPGHNYLWNLEWVSSSENMLHAVATGLKKDLKGEKRSNSIWTDDEVRVICSLMEQGHKATYIYNLISNVLKDPKITYERVRALYKHIIHKTHWTHISKDYAIDFSSHNYKKEFGSVSAAKERKNSSKADDEKKN